MFFFSKVPLILDFVKVRAAFARYPKAKGWIKNPRSFNPLIVIVGTFDSNEENPEDDMIFHMDDRCLSPYRNHITLDGSKYPS
jgi:hypothetical protein